MDPRPDSPSPLLADRYRTLERIGEGGSALVYRATDAHLGREVALKLLHDHVLPSDRRRFEREIRTLSRISHPGVISIYDLGTDEQGRLYFTMQLLEGGPFHCLGPLEDTPEQHERFLEAAHEVVAALDHIHAAGMIHRDLTPHNILLGADGRPRIMDFGLVYLSEGTRDLTRTGYTLGTPQYMAPEQAKGGRIGPATDLYSFGAVMYRAVTGRVPFEGDNDQAILYQHVYEPPLPPEQVNPAVPRPISEALLIFLAKRYEDRPASGAAAALHLRGALEAVRRSHVPGQYRGGLARAGYHPGGPTDPRRLEAAWELKLAGEVSWPAAVVGGRDYLAVGTRRSTLSLLEHSGHRYAELPAADEVTGPVTLERKHVVYGAWDGSVRKVDLRTGVERWRHRTRAEITSAPSRWGDSYLIASRDGHLHSVDEESGELRWAYKTVAPIAASPLVWGGSAIVADEEGWIHGLDASGGSPLWKVQLSAVHATPCVAPTGRESALLIVPTWEGELHALRMILERGRYRPDAADPLSWTYDLEAELWASPAVWGQRVFVGSWSGDLRCLDLVSGDDLWELHLGGRITASPVVSGGYVYVATEDGEVLAVNALSGTPVWRERFDVGVQATPLVMDGALYVAFMDGTVRAFRH
ncbi:outer membrane protein assembly factor BamB [Deinobacterium chartae]|uniref:Outer membrane protein assembly factor BamB n=1 Tax=Deinobacterium chartae TaxID=521158 RepID=A0A841HZA2_9DEIO|nr:serine/threonine-protein kinase [Deinobacterium chartae]MBB6097222.1 outer membrane protein assembly factor BamB [Deinobacterium chartae]